MHNLEYNANWEFIWNTLKEQVADAMKISIEEAIQYTMDGHIFTKNRIIAYFLLLGEE